MTESKESSPPSTDAAKRPTWKRFALGNAQMFLAMLSCVLLVRTGLNVYTIGLVILTSALTVISVLLYWDFPGLNRK